MAFLLGTSKCQCQNVLGMPMDVGECLVEGCEAKKSCWGERSLGTISTRLTPIRRDESETDKKRRSLNSMDESGDVGVTTGEELCTSKLRCVTTGESVSE